jgi:periplasmic mercuric ion binding protein
MTYIKFFLLAMTAFLSFHAFAQSQTDTIKVYGNCGMCKKRIEKAVKLEGVSNAAWSSETKLLIISYDAAKISNDQIQKSVAAVGHDTEKYVAEDAVYDKLPGCCLYERKKQLPQKQDQ